MKFDEFVSGELCVGATIALLSLCAALGSDTFFRDLNHASRNQMRIMRTSIYNSTYTRFFLGMVWQTTPSAMQLAQVFHLRQQHCTELFEDCNFDMPQQRVF